MHRLSAYVGGRDNNFNLIRFIAASLVLVSHSFALALGHGGNEPLGNLVGITLGRIAVDVFFITSGFLVTGSLVTRNEYVSFIKARMLRIYPALIVAVCLTVFVVGLHFTTHTVIEYFSSLETWRYLLLNSTLFFGLEPHLPGVFESLPYAKAINGSLWTLPWEVRMYAMLLCIAWLGSRLRKISNSAFEILVISLASVALFIVLAEYFLHIVKNQQLLIALRLTAMFFLGSAMYLMKERIILSVKVFGLLFLLLLLSSVSKEMFYVIYHIAVSYLVIFLAYVPKGQIRIFNSIGDYSYGIYIFAFPVQQSVVAYFSPTPLGLFLISFTFTLGLAILSWHFVEKPALKIKAKRSVAVAHPIGV